MSRPLASRNDDISGMGLYSRNKTVELGVYRRRGIAAVDAYGLSFLHDLSESFGERPGRFSYDLSAEDIAYGILNHGGFLVSVVAL